MLSSTHSVTCAFAHRSLGDPVEYARRKAEQLRVAREQSQRVAQAQAAQAAETQRRLLSYQDSKYRQEEMKAVMKQQEEQEQQRYAAQVSAAPAGYL